MEGKKRRVHRKPTVSDVGNNSAGFSPSERKRDGVHIRQRKRLGNGNKRQIPEQEKRSRTERLTDNPKKYAPGEIVNRQNPSWLTKRQNSARSPEKRNLIRTYDEYPKYRRPTTDGQKEQENKKRKRDEGWKAQSLRRRLVPLVTCPPSKNPGWKEPSPSRSKAEKQSESESRKKSRQTEQDIWLSNKRRNYMRETKGFGSSQNHKPPVKDTSETEEDTDTKQSLGQETPTNQKGSSEE